MSKKSVFCIAASGEQADRIVGQLKTANFSNNDISVLFPDKGTTRDFAHEKNTKAPEGAVAGAGTGGAIGGALGWIAGIGALAIPGVGPFIAAGPIIAALSGAAIGATVGGIAGGLIGLGIPEIEAKRYEGKVKAGNILISVHTENSEEITRAKDIFTQAGAQDICATGEASTTKDSKATERAAHLAEPGFNATRPFISKNNPCSGDDLAAGPSPINQPPIKETNMKTESIKSEVSGTGTHANRDPITGAPGAHPVGTGVGATGGAVAGAAIGAVAGPVGAAVGLVAGAVAGGLAGKGVAEKIDPTVQDAYWRNNYSNRSYVEKSVSYDVYRPAYRTGYEGYTRYPGKRYEEVESDLQRDYEKSKGNSNLTWDKARHATRDAWLHVEKALPGDADGDGRSR